MITWNISPILFSFGPVEIRWYSALFATGVLLYYFLTRRLFRGRGWAVDDFDSIVLYLFLGMVIGARLGEVLFYNFSYYLASPIEIFKVWNGGLSSHGAAIGVFVAYLIYWGVKKWKSRSAGSSGVFPFLKYVDVLAVGMPLVAGFVRLGNFFNSEIVGRATSAPWGVAFNGESFVRHPSQIYEMILAWGVFGILIWANSRLRVRPGFIMFLFIALYFSSRFFVEFFKGFTGNEAVNAGWFGLTMGQWLSVVPVVIGVCGIIATYDASKRARSRK